MGAVTAQAGGSRRGVALSTILAFSATSLPLHAAYLATAVYLPRHYAAHLGLDLALVGAAFFLVRMIDIPIDGILGWAMDKTRTRFGRYRVWTLIGAPILMASLLWLYSPPEGVGRTYLVVCLLGMYLGTSILHLSQAAWAATLAPSYDDRSRLFGVLAAAGVLGAAIVLMVPIAGEQQGLSEAQNVAMMGWLMAALAPLTALLVVWRTPERIAPEVAGHKFRFRDYWGLATRPSMLRILLGDLCLSLGPNWMGALYLFFFTDSRGFTIAQASILLAAYILAGFAGAPLIGRLAIRISKHRAVMVATTGFSLVLVSLMFVPSGNMAVALVPIFLLGFLSAGFTVLTRAMTADVADEVRLEQGRERSGLLFAMTVMTTKVAGAFSIGLTFFVLDRAGYIAKEGATNTADAIRGLEIAFLAGPIAFVMLGGACFIGYALSAERHAEIRRQLDARDLEHAPDQDGALAAMPGA